MAEVTPEVVTPEAPAAEAAPTPDPTAGQDVVTPEGDKPEAPEPEKMLPQSEVNKIVAKERAQERRRVERQAREYARIEAERDLLRQQLEQRKPDAPKGRPKSSDYENPEDYVEALADWKFEQREATRKEQTERETQTQRQQRGESERAAFVREKVFEPGVAKFKDFAEVVMSPDVAITEVMIAAAARQKAGVDTLYYLGQNPDEAQRIANLPDIEQAWAMKDIENTITARPKPTNAPPPIKPNDGNSAAKTGYRPEMSDKEFREWRARQIAQRNS